MINKGKIIREFKINDLFTVKLIKNFGQKKTTIFVKDEEFIQCKYILLKIPKDDIESTKEINSIDEAAVKLGHRLDFNIPDETLFWAHCSNLEAWTENNYDTRLLHRNIAFPLLKK